MGNRQVHAATASPPLSLPPTPIVGDTKYDQKSKSDQTADKSSGLLAEGTLRNPGTVEEMNRLCKDVFPNVFEGCRMIFNKGLSNHFQIGHTINMSNTTPAGYRFCATYVGTKMIGPGEAYPVMLGDIDPSGNLSANLIHQIHPRVKGRLIAQFQDSKCIGTQLTTDYKADTYTASGTLVNIDVVKRNGVAVCHLLKNLTPKLDLGCEIASQFSPGVYDTAFTLLGRYTSNEGDSVISGSLQASAARLHYFKKINENIKAAAELETNLAMGESVATVGYQIDIPNADLSFKGSLDSNLQVGAVLEKKLQPLPLTLTLSGAIDHGSKQPSYKFGCGLMIG